MPIPGGVFPGALRQTNMPNTPNTPNPPPQPPPNPPPQPGWPKTTEFNINSKKIIIKRNNTNSNWKFTNEENGNTYEILGARTNNPTVQKIRNTANTGTGTNTTRKTEMTLEHPNFPRQNNKRIKFTRNEANGSLWTFSNKELSKKFILLNSSSNTPSIQKIDQYKNVGGGVYQNKNSTNKFFYKNKNNYIPLNTAPWWASLKSGNLYRAKLESGGYFGLGSKYLYFKKTGDRFKQVSGVQSVQNFNRQDNGSYMSKKNTTIVFSPVNGAVNHNNQVYPVYKYQNRYSVIKNGKFVSTLGNKKINFVNNKYKLVNMNGQPPPPPAGTPEENLSQMNLYKLLDKRTRTRNRAALSAINKEIDKKLIDSIRNLEYKSRSERVTQYGYILRSLQSRSNFPGRGTIVGAIRKDIRNASRNKNAKYEMNRIRQNLKLNMLPVRDRNIRRTFEEELRILKNREKRYETAYGNERRRNTGPGPLPGGFPGGFSGGFSGGFPGAPPPPPAFPGGFAAPPPSFPSFAPPPPAAPRNRFVLPGAAPSNFGPLPNMGGLPPTEANAVKNAGGVNAAVNKVANAGGPTNVAKSANALQKAQGNEQRAVTEFGADPKALKLVVQVAGPTKNYNKINNLLNGINKLTKATKRARRAPVRRTVYVKRRAPVKRRTVTVKRKAPVKRRAPVRRVVVTKKEEGPLSCPMPPRAAELDKLLHDMSKKTIKNRVKSLGLLNNTTKNGLIKKYEQYILRR